MGGTRYTDRVGAGRAAGRREFIGGRSVQGQEPGTSSARVVGARPGVKYGAEWASRVGEAAAATLVLRRRSLIAAMASLAFVIASGIAIMLTGRQVYMSLPAVFRFCAAGAVVLAVVNVGIQRFRLPKLTKAAAKNALGHLRRTGHPQLARLPYSALRSLRAFDGYIATAAMSESGTT